MSGERQSFSPRHRSRVWNLLRASRRLFNFTPLRRWSAELTGIEMCREESFFLFSFPFFIKSKLLDQTVWDSFIKHLKRGRVHRVGCGMLVNASLCAPLYRAVDSKEYTASQRADCKWLPPPPPPKATTRPSLFRSVLTKARLLVGVGGGGGAAFVVDLCFESVPLPTTCPPSKLQSWARLPAPNFEQDTHCSAFACLRRD